MTQITVLPGSGNRITKALQRYNSVALGRRVASITMGLMVVAAAFCTPAFVAAAVPAAGDAYVYRVVNGYNRETVGFVRHEFTGATKAQDSVIAVTVDQPALGLSHTEIHTQDGQWLRHRLDNHGLATDYEFAPALPAHLLPLAPGKSWSVRVNAKVADDSRNRSVRIDGDVMGHERIRVPAGEFDTVKIRRIIYPGDAEYFKTETRIDQIDWYAPSLGRSVRSESRSSWEVSCRRGYCRENGDWNVLELTEARTATR